MSEFRPCRLLLFLDVFGLYLPGRFALIDNHRRSFTRSGAENVTPRIWHFDVEDRLTKTVANVLQRSELPL